MKLFKVLVVSAFITMVLSSCLKEEPITASAVSIPNFNQIPAGPGGISQTYRWTSIADFPGQTCDEAVSFILGNRGYVGLGIKYPEYQGDFYRYTPASNS